MKNQRQFIMVVCTLMLVVLQIGSKAQSTTVQYSIAGKTVYYYPLSGTNKVMVTVTGPGKLNITTRARFDNPKDDSLSYSVIYQIDDANVKIYKPSKVAKTKDQVTISSDNRIPSKTRTFSIKIDPENHNVFFYLPPQSPQVDMHYTFEAEASNDWKDLKSVSDTSAIAIKVDKSPEQNYYRFSKKTLQRFKVKGPTKLRIITRLEYDYLMQGTLSYRMKVEKNDTIAKIYKMTTKPSIEAQYVKDGKLIPGNFKKIYIDVPKGIHYYNFILLDNNFTALIRVSKAIKANKTK